MKSYKAITIVKALLLVVFVFSGHVALQAQTDEDSKTQVETMTIYGTFTPAIRLTPRIEANPGANDYAIKPPALDFEMQTEAIHSVEHSELLSGEPLPREEKASYPHNYLILGFGNYITPYGEYYANASAMNNHAFGIHLKHHSSQGGIKDYAKNAFSHNVGDIYYKYSKDSYTLKADVFLKRDVVHYYGFKPDEAFHPSGDSIRQRYFLGGTAVSFGSKSTIPTDYSFLVGLKYYNYSDRYKNMENAFRLNANLEKGFYASYANRVPQKAGGELDLAIYNNRNEMMNLGRPDTIKTVNTDIQVGIRPYFVFDWSEYRLKVGANLGLVRNSEKTSFYIHPIVEANIKVIQNRLYLFARVGGAIERNSFLSLTEENPFIAPGHFTADFMNKKITAAAGFSAMVVSGFDLKFGGEFSRIDKMPFYFSNPEAPTKNFFVQYDKVSLGDLFVEGNYTFSDKVAVGMALHYYICHTDTLAHAYYKPDFKLHLEGMYRPIERLRIAASFNFFSRMWGVDPYGEVVQDVRLPVLYNLNVNAEFRVWRELYLFVEANNIFAQNYEYYLNYPSQSFNVIGGVKFRF